MVTANLVRQLSAGATLYVIAQDVTGKGLAYSTTNTDHLLNVQAGRMGAFSDDTEGLMTWLKKPAASLAKQRLGLHADYAAQDYIPRALYGAYLEDIWRTTQETAAARGVLLKLVETTATCIRADAVLTARGDAIAVDAIVLATGNEIKPVLAQVVSPHIIQNPWAPNALAGAAHWASPVMLFGAGLTAVDMVLSLRAAGYQGEIIAASRHGRWPQPHIRQQADFTFDADILFAQQNLPQLLRYVRNKIQETGDWRAVIDALRPHTHALWKRLSPHDQSRFMRRLLSMWNIHRHRMAPEIGARIQSEMLRETLKLVACKSITAKVENDQLSVTLKTAKETRAITPSRVINCAGGELNITRSANPLLKQALADQLLEPHATGLGCAVDPNYRAWGAAYPHLYVIGPLMTGQWLETAAVPELREQADHIAQHIALSAG